MTALVHFGPASTRARVHALELRARSTLESGVTLPEDSAILPPSFEINVFHVEHTPIQEPAAFAGTSFDQLMHTRLHDVDRQCGSKRRSTGRQIAVQFLLQPPALQCHTRARHALALPNLPEHAESVAPALDEFADLSRAERAAAAEQVNALQNARLAGAVRAE